jgi:hypothetical protein
MNIMESGLLDLYIHSGDIYARSFTFTAGDLTPIDLTGCVAELQLVAMYSGAGPYLLTSETATDNCGTITPGGTAGTVNITIPPADRLLLANGRWELKIKFTDHSAMTFLSGSVFIEQEVAGHVHSPIVDALIATVSVATPESKRIAVQGDSRRVGLAGGIVDKTKRFLRHIDGAGIWHHYPAQTFHSVVSFLQRVTFGQLLNSQSRGVMLLQSGLPDSTTLVLRSFGIALAPGSGS